MAAGNQRKLEFILRSKHLLLAHKINYVCMNTSPNVNEYRHFFSKRHRLKRGLDSGLWTLLWTLCKKDSKFSIFNSEQVSLADISSVPFHVHSREEEVRSRNSL